MPSAGLPSARAGGRPPRSRYDPVTTGNMNPP
jgi:hypothetical protein